MVGYCSPSRGLCLDLLCFHVASGCQKYEAIVHILLLLIKAIQKRMLVSGNPSLAYYGKSVGRSVDKLQIKPRQLIKR